MNLVFVMDAEHRPLSMCHPARARALLKSKEAAVFRQFPFTIILKEEKPEAVVKPITAKIDPGSKTTGIVLVKVVGKSRNNDFFRIILTSWLLVARTPETLMFA